MSMFTGLGAPKESGLNAQKALTVGTNAYLGAYTTNWLMHQAERWANRKQAQAPAAAPVEKDSTEYAEQVMLESFEGLKAMRDWMAKDAGPVEDWDGEPTFNLKVLQYIKDFFPQVFEDWRVRNYGGGPAVGVWREQVAGALMSLGWQRKQAFEAADMVAPLAEEMIRKGQEPDVSALLRAALSKFAPPR